MKRSVALFFAIISITVSGQDSIRNKWLIKTDLVSYFPSFKFNTGKLNLELERPLSNRQSLAFQVAYIYSYGVKLPDIINNVHLQNTSGILASVNYKRFFNRHRVIEPLCLLIWPLVLQLHSIKNENTGLYFSAQASYMHSRSAVNYVSGPAITESIKRVNPSFLLRIGFQSVGHNRTVVDQGLGVGIQYIKSYKPIDGPVPPPIAGSLYPFVNYYLKIGIAL